MNIIKENKRYILLEDAIRDGTLGKIVELALLRIDINPENIKAMRHFDEKVRSTFNPLRKRQLEKCRIRYLYDAFDEELGILNEKYTRLKDKDYVIENINVEEKDDGTIRIYHKEYEDGF